MWLRRRFRIASGKSLTQFIVEENFVMGEFGRRRSGEVSRLVLKMKVFFSLEGNLRFGDGTSEELLFFLSHRIFTGDGLSCGRLCVLGLFAFGHGLDEGKSFFFRDGGFTNAERLRRRSRKERGGGVGRGGREKDGRGRGRGRRKRKRRRIGDELTGRKRRRRTSILLRRISMLVGRRGSGRRELGRKVSGVGSSFTTALSVGNMINVGGQVRVITAIGSDTSLTVGNAFSPNLPAGTLYSYSADTTSYFIVITQP